MLHEFITLEAAFFEKKSINTRKQQSLFSSLIQVKLQTKQDPMQDFFLFSLYPLTIISG